MSGEYRPRAVLSLHGRKSQLPASVSLFPGYCGKLRYRS